MAIFHYHMQSIGRNLSGGEGVVSAGVNVEGVGTNGRVSSAISSSGVGNKAKPNRSAVACAAYRSGSSLVEKIYDKTSGMWFENVHNYSYKQGVVLSQIFAPASAPSWMLDREELWNRIQNEFDTAKNSVFAKEMDIALPKELSVEQNIELIGEFVEDILLSSGLVADVNFHNDNEGNPHIHIMTSTRHLVTLEDGSTTFGNKIREIDNKSFLHYLRASFASYTNKHLEKYGFAERVDHRSYKDRGITIVPSIHEGVGRHCENSDRARINAEIMSARAAQIVSEPEQVIKLLGISNAYFTLATIEEKVSSFILDDSKADRFVIRDRASDAVDLENPGESGNAPNLSNNIGSGLDQFSLDPDGNIVFDSSGYSKFSEVRGNVVASVLGSDSIVKLEGLSELGEYYTTAARVQSEERFLNLAQGLEGLSNVGLGVDKGNPLYKHLSQSEIELLKAPDPLKNLIKTQEQQSVVRGIVEGGSLVQLYGYAGTGKSTVLASVRDIYAGRGVSVIGIAPTAKSRGVLSDLGIEAQTLHSLKAREEWVEGILLKMESGNFDSCSEWEMSFARNYKSPFNASSVFMLDEASMVDLDIYSWLIQKCEGARAKLISIGDYNQLPVVKGIGGAFRALIDYFADKTFSLTEVWRQKDPVYKEITRHLASYKVSDALLLLKEQKVDACKFIDGDRRDVELRLVGDYVSWFKEQNSLRDMVREEALSTVIGSVQYEVGSHFGYSMDGGFIDASKSGVIISYLREDIARLNSLVREDLYLSGVLESKVFTENNSSVAGDVLNAKEVGTVVARGKIDSQLKPIALLLGEQIMFLKNDKKVGLYNGEVATILDIREAASDKNLVDPSPTHYDILVRIHGGDNNQRLVWFNSKDYGHFDYGYASTIHKVQGSSYDKVFFDFSKYVGFESFYVGVTRHMKDLNIYFNKDELTSILYQRYGVSESSAKDLSGNISLSALTGLAGAGGDERNLYFAAIEAFVSRRSSDIFVSEFARNGRGLEVDGSDGSSRSVSNAESIFAEYHSVRNKAAALYREILLEVGSSGLKRVAYHSRWGEFKDLTSKRGELAKVIISDIDRFEACLKITKANMSVIRDHAGLSVFGIEKIYGNIISNSSRSNLVNSDAAQGNERAAESSTARSAFLSEYRNICDMQMDALYRGKDGSNHRDVVLANLMLESSSLSSSQRSIADEIEGFNAKRENLTQQLRIVSQDIEVCAARMSNIAEGLSKIYSGDPKIVVEKFSEYLRESGVSLDELSIALKDDKISDNVRRLELHRVDLSKFGEIKGKEYNLGLFKLSGFDKRQNLANREFVVNNIVEYLNSEREFGALLEKKTYTDGELGVLMSSYDKDIEVRESKFLGYVALGHLEKITSNGDVVSLGKWLETSEATKSCFSGYALIRRESSSLDLVAGRGVDEKLDRRVEVDSDLFLNRSEIRDLKQSLLSRIDPASIARFFEVNRGDIGAGDLVTIRSGVLKCGSFNLHLSGEKAGQWYRFSRSEGGDIYKLAQVLGSHGSGGEWNNFKVVAGFAGIDVDNILKRCSENGFQNIAPEISKEIQDMRVENISGLGSNYVPSYKDKWMALARVPSDARGFDLLEDAPYLVGRLDGLDRLDGVAKTYDYKDINGNLVCHIVRLEKGDGVKTIYPISYCKNSETGEYGWRVKGFADGNIIYGAEKLGAGTADDLYKNKPILIVEGEKTANEAQKLAQDSYAVISWSGGSSGASKVDWSLLAGRHIVIWPDNDVAGIKAASVIEKSMRENNIAVKSLNIIDVRALGLENGWDLADRLPEHLKKFSVSDIIADSASAIDDRRLAVSRQIGAITWNVGASEPEKTRVLEAEASRKLQEAGVWNEEYRTRLAHELSVIERSGSAEEFRIAANIVKYCRSENIEVGFGRGSAVGSLTAYALDIHSVDPVKYDLSFERFLSEGKSTIPDFDIDVSSKDRERVVDYLFNALGDRVALMTTIDEKRHPSAIVILPEGVRIDDVESSGACRFTLDDKSMRPIMSLNDGVKFKELEQQGFRKVDLLASNMLDKTYSVMEEIGQKYGVNLSVDEIFSAARNDKEAYGLIADADTDGIFQLESESAKNICGSIRPKDFDSLVNILALNRPGTREWVQLFAQISTKESGQEAEISRNVRIAIPPHDPLGVFASTKGAILFQEQVMEAGVKYFGISEKDSDGFRRDLANESEDRVIANKDKCIERLMSSHKDISRGQAVSLYSSLEKFAGFGFNKSHAVAYAKHTIVTAYLKAHYGEEFCRGFGISDDEKMVEKKQKSGPVIGANATWDYNADFMKEIERLAPHVVRNLKSHINSAADVVQLIKASKSVILEDHVSGKLDNVRDIGVIQKSMLSHIEGMTRVQNSKYSDLIDEKGEMSEGDLGDNYTNKAYEKIKVEIKSEIISKICAGLGRYKEKEYGGSSDNSLYEAAEKLYNKRDEKIKYEFEHNKVVREFAKICGSDAARYFATQIVDYKMQQDPMDTGAWEHSMTERRLDIMKNVSQQQILLDKQLDGALQVHGNLLNNSSNDGGHAHILTPEIMDRDKLALREVAQLRLCRDMTMKIQEMGIDNLDVAIAQKMRNENIIDSTKALAQMQHSYISERKEEVEDNKERQISRSHGRGMEM